MNTSYAYEEICVDFNFKSLQSRRSITDLVFHKILSNNINCPYLFGKVTLRVSCRALRDKSFFMLTAGLFVAVIALCPVLLPWRTNSPYMMNLL